MYIAKQDVALAMQIAEAKKKEHSIRFNQANVDAYKELLAGIAKKNPYAEGQKLSLEDFDIVFDGMRTMLNGMVENFYARPEDVRNKANIAGMILAASDYMIAITMDELNSPDIAKDDMDRLERMYQARALRLCEQKSRKLYISDEILKAQRGINAEEMKSGNIGKLLKAVRDDSNNAEKVADLYAEYQALFARQKNHGAIWRFFHRKENEARTALLNEMKEAMAGKVSETDLLEPYIYPSSIIAAAEKAETEKAISEGIFERETNPEKGFGYAGYKKDSNQPVPGLTPTLKNFLKVDYRPNMDRIAEEKAMLKPYIDAKNKNQIWAEDTAENRAIRELFARNYMRLRIAAQKLEEHNGNIELAENEFAKMNEYYRNEDKDFAMQYPNLDDIKIPEIPAAPAPEEKKQIDFEQLKKDTTEAPQATSEKHNEVPKKDAPDKSLN